MESATPQTNFLQDAPGSWSSGRLQFLVWGTFAIVGWCIVWFHTFDYVAALATFSGIAGVATAHKGISSYNESKTRPDGN